MSTATLTNRQLYDLWAAVYPAAAHNPLMRIEQEIVEPLLTRLTATRALDVGTGSGRYLPALAATGAQLVVGADYSMGMLERIETAPCESHVSRVCADAQRLPFRPATFDLVNASLMVGDIGDLRGWAAEVARVLRRGGNVVYSDFHPCWAEHRWRRTFQTADGTSHDLSYASHSIDEHLGALETAGFRVAAIREPRFRTDDADPAVAAFRRRWRNPAVVVIFHAVKER